MKIFIAENHKESKRRKKMKRRKEVNEAFVYRSIHLDLKDLPLNRNRSEYLNKFTKLVKE